MGILDWLLILGVGLAYLFVLLAVIWLVFRRSRTNRPHDPAASRNLVPRENSVPSHSRKGGSHTEQ